MRWTRRTSPTSATARCMISISSAARSAGCCATRPPPAAPGVAIPKRRGRRSRAGGRLHLFQGPSRDPAGVCRAPAVPDPDRRAGYSKPRAGRARCAACRRQSRNPGGQPRPARHGREVGIGTRMVFKDGAAGFAVPLWTLDDSVPSWPPPGAIRSAEQSFLNRSAVFQWNREQTDDRLAPAYTLGFRLGGNPPTSMQSTCLLR
jgi:hypothetical protein